ncbi:MAG TPA: aspartate aminotransferase family protein [Candidatus Acidoferrales bacterium]|nr:aspartate aminotransferase family protein [Candidatus Acidoferrales bacterium]
MTTEFTLVPRSVARVETSYRRIVTQLPVPESIPILQKLYQYEPLAMRGQPPVVWHRAEGFQVYDAWGNQWIDWSSGVLIANAGHGRAEIANAIANQARSHLLTSFSFANEPRARLVERLASILPEPLKKVFLYSTGSEAIECAIKMCRTYGVKAGGRSKHVIVTFENAFHGRTLGAQQAGGIPSLKEWIVNLDPGFVQVPFPDGFRTPDTSFESFERALGECGIEPQNVAGVMLETYQGGSSAFAPVPYMQLLRKWCTGHKALLVCDEIQAGFGRTGTLWGFEHYGVVPDLAVFGKGISGSLPVAAVAGRPDVLDLYPPLSMTSSHAGNPVCCAAALASVNLVIDENLAEKARVTGDLLHRRLRALAAKHRQVGCVAGKGLVAGVACVKPGTTEPDAALAFRVVQAAMERGVLMFAPVGFGGATVKISPPLIIAEDAVNESVDVLEAAFTEAVAGAAAVA